MAIHLQSGYDAHKGRPSAQYQSVCQSLLRNLFARHQKEKGMNKANIAAIFIDDVQYDFKFRLFDFDVQLPSAFIVNASGPSSSIVTALIAAL